MSAGGDIVTLDKPGDEHLVAEVMSLREVPPITVDEMVSVFGPNWEALSELMRQAARMTPAQAEMAVKAWRIVSSGERDAAWSAVQDAACP